jgi:hypothetical protein
MADVKDSKSTDKVSKDKIEEIHSISFCFQYQTKNKSYCFKYFNKASDSYKAYSYFFEKLCELSTIDMNEAKTRGKISGCEPIPYKNFSKSFKKILAGTQVISKDSVLSVFRFCQNDYRLICKTDINHSNLLHVIGFDFDFSAYSHG